jgi:putative PIN family toxin of toxin-antitoxin system
MRVVVDTNVWVSALLTPAGPPGRVQTALRNAQFSLIISEPLIAEAAEVLARPRFATRYGLVQDEIDELLSL